MLLRDEALRTKLAFPTSGDLPPGIFLLCSSLYLGVGESCKVRPGEWQLHSQQLLLEIKRSSVLFSEDVKTGDRGEPRGPLGIGTWKESLKGTREEVRQHDTAGDRVSLAE